MHVRSFIPLLLTGLLLTSCGIFQSTTSNSLPKEYSEVEWGMTPEELAEHHTIELAHDREFRKVYIEQYAQNENLENVIYYFGVIDGMETNPLYEVILNFKSAEARDNFAAKQLGEVDFVDEGRNEWRWTEGGDEFAAWTFQNKLVIVKRVAGTEWDGEGIWAQ